MNIDTDNAVFQDALNLIQYTRQSIFLTGKAGTGKSTFLRYVCEHTKKKHVVLAPTGIAAINAGGSTMHSFFKLPFYPLLPDDPKLSLQRGRIHEFFKYTKPHRKLLEQIELVIIDEISMVRADIIDAVHSNNKNIDCAADYKICKYFSSGECNHKTLSNIDEAVICPYYLINKKD